MSSLLSLFRDNSFGPGHAPTATTESGISMKDASQKQSRPIIAPTSKRLREGSCGDGYEGQIRINSRRRENCRRTEASSEEYGRGAQRGRSNGLILESFVPLILCCAACDTNTCEKELYPKPAVLHPWPPDPFSKNKMRSQTVH